MRQGGAWYRPRAMAAIDPVAFLRGTAPFHALPRELFDGATVSVDVAYLPAGTHVVRAGGEPLQHLYVIRKGAVRLEREGQTLQVLEEGETFGYTSLITGAATLDVVVEEDLVAYRLPGEAFRNLLGDAQFAGHFAVGLSERLKASLEHATVATFRSDLSREVQDLLRRPAVWVETSTTVGEAARVMRDERISSVLVPTDPPGIVTDRDFRNRVLADDLGPETPLLRVLSRPLRTVPAGTPVYEAWRTLLDEGVHHLPVVREGAVIGVLTSGDLLKHTAQGPVALLRSVERLSSRESLPGYGTRVAEMASALVAGRLEVAVIAGFVARLNDALLRRIARWAEADLGPPPAPYAWVAFGSEGRMEQTLLTDQDNALVYADEGADRRQWFQAFAERINDDLEAAGFQRCAGGYMARRWHGPLSEWMRRFAGWIDTPGPQALLEASIFFDYRRVDGQLRLDPLDEVVSQSVKKPAFLRFLAKAALEFRPPASLLLRLRGEASEVDLKLHGISPIVFLARCYGLAAGTAARNTIDRLEAAERAGLVDRETTETIEDAYRFLLGLRLRLQLRMVAEGREATNRVALSELTAVERSRVKDAFRAIRVWQECAAFHYKTGF
jgi:CBS domain-containing protein